MFDFWQVRRCDGINRFLIFHFEVFIHMFHIQKVKNVIIEIYNFIHKLMGFTSTFFLRGLPNVLSHNNHLLLSCIPNLYYTLDLITSVSRMGMDSLMWSFHRRRSRAHLHHLFLFRELIDTARKCIKKILWQCVFANTFL